MDIEVMQAEAAITDFINTFMNLARDSGSGLGQHEMEEFKILLNVAKTVHIAQLSIGKMINVENLKDRNDES